MSDWADVLILAYAFGVTGKYMKAVPVLCAARQVAELHDQGEMSNALLEELATAITRFDGEDDDPDPPVPRWRLRLIWWAHLVLPLRVTHWHFSRLSEATQEALIESDFWPHRPKAKP